MIRKSIMSACVSAGLLGASLGSASATCEQVTFSDVGWTDITSTTAVSSVILDALGYETETKLLSVPVTYASLAKGDIDVFLGNCMPTMEADIAPYRDAGTVDTVRENLEGAKYTLAVNDKAAMAGIRNFADIAKFRDKLDSKIYGIEPFSALDPLIRTHLQDELLDH